MKLLNWLFALLFGAVLWLPLLQMKYQIVKPSVAIANEAKAELPSLDF